MLYSHINYCYIMGDQRMMSFGFSGSSPPFFWQIKYDDDSHKRELSHGKPRRHCELSDNSFSAKDSWCSIQQINMARMDSVDDSDEVERKNCSRS